MLSFSLNDGSTVLNTINPKSRHIVAQTLSATWIATKKNNQNTNIPRAAPNKIPIEHGADSAGLCESFHQFVQSESPTSSALATQITQKLSE